MELAYFNLKEYILSEDEIIPKKEIKLIILSLFYDLLLLHSTKHCHRDIKPANILFFDTINCPWKFGDYGLSM
jgi:serine/threonine protein kinase